MELLPIEYYILDNLNYFALKFVRSLNSKKYNIYNSEDFNKMIDSIQNN